MALIPRGETKGKHPSPEKTMSFLRRFLLPLAAAALVHGTAQAAWPGRPIRIIVPYAAGGFTDVLAPPVGTRLADKLRQPVIVENKPGASTMLGAEAAAHASPDGYTLLMATTSTISTNPLLFRKMTYKA